MVFNAIFNNILVISWRSVLLVEEIRVPGENHWPAASHWQTLLCMEHFFSVNKFSDIMMLVINNISIHRHQQIFIKLYKNAQTNGNSQYLSVKYYILAALLLINNHHSLPVNNNIHRDKTRMVVMPSMFPLINTHSSCNLKNNINWVNERLLFKIKWASQTCLSDPLHITTFFVSRPHLFLPSIFPCILPLYNDPLSNDCSLGENPTYNDLLEDYYQTRS